MSIGKFLIIMVMMFNCLFSLLIYSVYELDLITSISFFINLIISYFILFNNSPEKQVVKLSLIYLLGFSLFVGGRFISGLFGVGNIYCFDFGYFYCLDFMEILKINFLIHFSLIFFVFGFLYNKNKPRVREARGSINNKILSFVILISFFSGFCSFYFKTQAIALALSQGYMVLYEGQSQSYSTPLSLVIDTIFVATLAVIYSLKDRIKSYYFLTLISVFIITQLLGVLTGARSSFILGIIILIWVLLGDREINIKKLLFSIPLVFLLFSANYIASLSGARVADSGITFFEKFIIDIFYNQGITMMVFSLGVIDNNFPLLAYLKVLLPGIQVFFSFFENIYQYELSFSQNLTYRLAPNVYYENMGWGWSLLGDFYAFSFGITILFLIYNFFWGKVIYTVSLYSESSIYYRGLFFCFIVTLFSISRSSVSYLIFLIIVYTLIYFFIKIKVRVN